MKQYKPDIYIVEDNATVLENICEFFQEKSYKIVGTSDNALQTISDVIMLKPDLLVIDIKLKGELSGFEAVRRIREDYFCSVLFLTANVNEADIKEALSMTCVDYNTKPYSDEILMIALHRLRQECYMFKSIKLKNNYSFNMETLTLYTANKKVELTNKEQQLIELMAKHRGKLLLYETIDYILWSESVVTKSTRNNLFQKLSKKVEPFWEIKKGIGLFVFKS